MAKAFRATLKSPPRNATFDIDELERGIIIEMEHTDDPATAAVIAMHHLHEHPLYYVELVKMEKRLARRKK
jgi:hypothetical protein